jgi:hypothetical protein
MSSQAYERFLETLKSADERYDPDACMTRRPFSSPGYHTALQGGFVHPTRESLSYAVTCLDAGDEEHLHRAEDILLKVTSLQDSNPSSRTYGIWSWFLEEPLDKMGAPDWNWANFCGVSLLQVLLYHRSRISEVVRTKIEESLRHACESIMRRDVGPGYTNIAVMGIYVTLVSGERLGWREVEAYGLKSLKRFHDYTMDRRSFDEYNSPTYTRVAISEIARMLHDVQNPEALAKIGELDELIWHHLARRFHAPTRQWAGPHSRCYSTLQGRDFIAFLQAASDGKLSFLPQEEVTSWPRDFVRMPGSVLPYFEPLREPRTEMEVFAPASNDAPATVGTTYLHPEFTLASVNHSMLWNQRRAVVAYWGSAEEPSYLHLRFLHDGYDFSSAWVFTAQHEGSLLAAVTFVTDSGDTHPGLDKVKDGRIRAHDLRLRLEIGGAAAKQVQSREWNIAEPLVLALHGIDLQVQVPSSSFGNQGAWGRVLGPDEAGSVFRPRPGQKPSASQAAVDVILHTGAEETFELAKLTPVFIAMGLQLGAQDAVTPSAELKSGGLRLSMGSLNLSAPLGPLPTKELVKALKGLDPG